MPNEWSGTVIQATRTDELVTLALDFTSLDAATLALTRGSRLACTIDAAEFAIHFHGWMKSWAMHSRFFGSEAVAALARDPGIEAYLQGAKTMGGTKVPGHDEWLRLRPVEGSGPGIEARFDIAVGSAARLQVTEREGPSPYAPPRLKEGTLQTTVLASHRHALTLAVDAPALRKLKGRPDGWHRLQVGEREFRILARRGIPFEREGEVWEAPEALLFEYEAHFDDERITVMHLTPMQQRWKGRYPDWATVTIPSFPTGSVARLRVE